MVATGIVRRIDELGRVVIPKELRRTMRIKEGEELEVFVSSDNSLVLKKYSSVKSVSDFCDDYVKAVSQVIGMNCMICDTDTVVSCVNDKQQYLGKQISKSLEKFLYARKAAYLRLGESFPIVPDERQIDMVVSPIIKSGDIFGGIIITDKGGMRNAELALCTAELASAFLSRQL